MINVILESFEQEMMGDFQNDVLVWANHINLIKGGDNLKQIDKIQEELDEYREAIENDDYCHACEELIDVFVTLIVSAEQNGIKIINHLGPVIKKLQSRQDSGRMVDGLFYKAEDL